MCTYYVLYDPSARLFAKVGHSAATTWSLNCAKHFTSKWSAEQWLKKHDMFLGMIPKRIERY